MTQTGRSHRRRSMLRGRSIVRRQGTAWSDLRLPGMVIMATVALMLVGGAPLTILSVAVLVISTLALLVAIAMSPNATSLANLPWQSKTALVAVVLLPLLEIVPLPPALWQALPGQDIRRMVLTTIGKADTWQPISLTPLATMEAAVACMTFTALAAAMLLLNNAQLRQIGWLLLGLVLANIAVGTLQVTSGGYPIIWESRNQGAMLGFFANKNHMGLFVAASMPLAWFLLDVRRRDVSLYLFLGWCVLALVALIATNSRSGLSVGMVAAAALSLQFLSKQSIRIRMVFLTTALVAATVISFSNPFGALFARFADVDDDLRWQFWSQSMPLLKTYWPLGSGAGSYSQVFIVNEHLLWVKPTYVNAAHNDFLQLIIEFGVPGVMAMLLFFVVLSNSALSHYSAARWGSRTGIIAGMTIILLYALQSLVDYPLRRVATLPLFAFATVLILRTVLAREPDDDCPGPDFDAGFGTRASGPELG